MRYITSCSDLTGVRNKTTLYSDIEIFLFIKKITPKQREINLHVNERI